MKLSYYLETDSLYIDLSAKASIESREISEGVVLDMTSKATLWGAILTTPLNELIVDNLSPVSHNP